MLIFTGNKNFLYVYGKKKSLDYVIYNFFQQVHPCLNLAINT